MKNKWQLANALVVIQDEDDSTVEWLLHQWLIRLISGMITAYYLDNRKL